MNRLVSLSRMTNFTLFQTGRVLQATISSLMKGREFSIRVENTVGKAEIAHYEQFLLFPRCFQKTGTADT